MSLTHGVGCRVILENHIFHEQINCHGIKRTEAYRPHMSAPHTERYLPSPDDNLFPFGVVLILDYTCPLSYSEA